MKKVHVMILLSMLLAGAAIGAQAQSISPQADKLLYCSAAFQSASLSANDDTRGVMHFFSERLANDGRTELQHEGHSSADVDKTISAYQTQYQKDGALNKPVRYTPHECELAAGLNENAG